MLTYRNLCTLSLLLLLHVCGSAMKFFLLKGNAEPQDGDVRLFGSESHSEGRVEVYHEGKWGTVCDDGWDMAEAQVVCRQLRFPGAKSVVNGKDYGQVSGPIWLDDMECKGTENHLFSCAFKAWGVTDCTHKEDVGVICESAMTPGTNVTMGDSTHLLDHSISLSNELGQIFDSEDNCDLLITVKSATGKKYEDGTEEMVTGTTVCTHKMILSRFPLFHVEGATEITINISQSCQPYFTSFIRYIYTRKIEVSFSSAQCLHLMASEFGVKQLMEETGRLFTKILPEDTSFYTPVSLYEYAVETGDLILQENCIQYLAWNYENLTASPAWTHLSVEILGALLTRSDLVVQDEYFLLQTVENWIMQKGNLTGLETQAELLGRIRFPMIPVEKLHDLESNSSLYATHKNMYWEKMLKAFQFNVLLFSNLKSNPKFNTEDDDYKSRIYTAEPWSTTISPSRNSQSNPAQPRYTSYNNRRSYGYYTTVSPHSQSMKSFSTPIHNSLIFKDNKVPWEANILTKQRECSHRGLRCESFPVVRLAPPYYYTQQSGVLFRNRLLLICQNRFICQVQDFKASSMVHVSVNGTYVTAYPCPDEKYTYRFVVRPEYA